MPTALAGLVVTIGITSSRDAPVNRMKFFTAYLFSGLLKCGVCDASFVLRNRDYYCCGSYRNGAACSNEINVSCKFVEDILLAGIRQDLADPSLIEEVAARVRDALRRSEQPAVDNGQHISQVESEITSLTDAIGLLRYSPALGEPLRATESELSRLRVPSPKRPVLLVPDVRKRYLDMVAGLDGEPDRGREERRGILGSRITL